MATLAHRARVLAHLERKQTDAAARALAIFETISALAQCRPQITDPLLLKRIDSALSKSHIALNGEHLTDLPSSVIPIVKRS
jgi:hypothetical protein